MVAIVTKSLALNFFRRMMPFHVILQAGTLHKALVTIRTRLHILPSMNLLVRTPFFVSSKSFTAMFTQELAVTAMLELVQSQLIRITVRFIFAFITFKELASFMKRQNV